MADLSAKDRGAVLKIVAVTQYPDGDVKAVPIAIGDRVKLIMFDRKEIERRLAELKVDRGHWETGSWKTNPSILIEQTDGIVILYCIHTGHKHIPNMCYAAGPIVHPPGQLSDPAAEDMHL